MPGQPIGVRTDTNGVFRLDRDATLREFTITAEGYESDAIELSPGQQDLQITLDAQTDPAEAFEDLGARETFYYSDGQLTRKSPSYARSATGYRRLREALVAGRPANVPAGRVKFNFLVNSDGLLSEFSFPARTDRATRDYLTNKMRELSDYEILRGEDPVRVYFKVDL